jgi:hypothetical protein
VKVLLPGRIEYFIEKREIHIKRNIVDKHWTLEWHKEVINGFLDDHLVWLFDCKIRLEIMDRLLYFPKKKMLVVEIIYYS